MGFFDGKFSVFRLGLSKNSGHSTHPRPSAPSPKAKVPRIATSARRGLVLLQSGDPIAADAMAGNALADPAAGHGPSRDRPRTKDAFRPGDRSATGAKRHGDLCLDPLGGARVHQLQEDYRNLGPGGSLVAESSVAASWPVPARDQLIDLVFCAPAVLDAARVIPRTYLSAPDYALTGPLEI
jgi:hypothetical protein